MKIYQLTEIPRHNKDLKRNIIPKNRLIAADIGYIITEDGYEIVKNTYEEVFGIFDDRETFWEYIEKLLKDSMEREIC